MTNRRNFLKQAVAASVIGGMPSFLAAANSMQNIAPVKQPPATDKIWANLLHLSYNMWSDNVPLKYRDENFNCTTCQEAREWAHPYRPFLTFNDETWDALLNEMASVGMNMVVIDVGDGIQYECHPEISVKNAWSHEKLKSELAKMKKLGLEPIPKLNFATTHDIWMGKYSRMVSTEKYYEVCRNLISEVIELFDAPRFFHLGMDEETYSYQRHFDYAVIRQNEMWWGDFYFLIGEIERKGVRPWIWSDYAWHYPDMFFKKMPKSVLQSNWYYGTEFDIEKLTGGRKKSVSLYAELDKHGFDQVPTGSNHSNETNMELTVDYCKKNLDSSRLYGFMTAPWRPTLPQCLDRHKDAIAQMGRGIKKF